MNWKASDVETAQKRAGVRSGSPAAVAPPVAPAATDGAVTATKNEPGPQTHLIGPYALCLADPRHYPGRSRHSVTGPDAPGLTQALRAALEAFVPDSAVGRTV